MSHYKPNESDFSQLKDKVIVLTGGSTGIGAATVTILANNGARVVFGDINSDAANQLISSLQGNSKGEVTFVPCNVTSHKDIHTLFKTAYDKYGVIDHAVSSAGIFEQGNWISPELTIENLSSDEGNSVVLDVNVLGSARFTRIATVFMRENIQKGTDNKSLILLSSVNAFRESPGLYMYQTSKHAIHGLFRASRKTVFERDGIRVNAVCPGVTESAMTVGIVEKFRDAGLFWQKAEVVAEIIVSLMTAKDIHGKAYYIEGGDAWEFEDSFYEEQPRWLGEEPTRRVRKNTEGVQKGLLLKS